MVVVVVMVMVMVVVMLWLSDAMIFSFPKPFFLSFFFHKIVVKQWFL